MKTLTLFESIYLAGESHADYPDMLRAKILGENKFFEIRDNGTVFSYRLENLGDFAEKVPCGLTAEEVSGKCWIPILPHYNRHAGLIKSADEVIAKHGVDCALGKRAMVMLKNALDKVNKESDME